jgi:hypothetical protein
MRELAVNMISKIKSTPMTELPDQDLHEKMFYLEHDVEDYLSEEMINEKIEAFKQTMKDEQGIIVTTTHRNSLIQAEIETKEEYLRLNQGSGESVLDRTSSGTSGLIVKEDPEVTKIKNESQNGKENEGDKDDKDLKMKSKFEGMKGFKAPKPTKERIPDENSNLEDVKNSISVEWMKGALEGSESEEDDAIEDEDFDGEEGRVRREKVNDKGKKGGKVKVQEEEVEDEEAAEARRKEQVERLERINAMRGKEYLIGWG